MTPDGRSGEDSGPARPIERVRIATCQMEMRVRKDYADLLGSVEYFTSVASDYGADFIVFPELFTLALLSSEERKLDPGEAVERLTSYTARLRQDFSALAQRHSINLIAGSHLTRTADGSIRNIALVCLRDGSIHEQHKIHPTPNERESWALEGGHAIRAIPTDCGLVGVLICYDSEFPELARLLADQGARILFVPFCTDTREAYLRVRHCAQARAIENQCYVALSGNVGNLPNVANMDIQYAQSCILTPCDFRFARDGIAAEASANVEGLTFADLSLSDLEWARNAGSVRNLADRRFDLYRIELEQR